MKHELGKDYYNNVYLSAKKYAAKPNKSPYYKIWLSIFENISKHEKIADFGCGTGQFIKLAHQLKRQVVYGVDFSEVAIEKAGIFTRGVELYCDSLYNDVYNKHPYDVAVLLEVLEHVKDDLGILKKIPKGKRVIISVPNWDTESHVRHFDSVEQAKQHYSQAVQVNRGYTFKVGSQGKEIYVLYTTT